MTLQHFFTTRAVVFIILFLVFGLFAYTSYAPTPLNMTATSTPVAVENTTPPTFVWKSEAATTTNLDGLPKTTVFVEATYADGSVVRKQIDTPDGSCNVLEDSKIERLANTSIYQCYAAGFGYYYRIAKGESSYVIQRKGFEEGSPEYTPPEYPFENVGEFSFMVK